MEHSKYMRRCIEIAKNGLGSTAPNPMVGCVIVNNDKIIGEGYTSSYGCNHAEVNAINSVKNKDDLVNSTLYVTLEPCSHHGKTPPCTDLIIKNKIPKVVVGCNDPNKSVEGNGIAKLRNAGCQVITEIEKSLCENHHKRFLTFHNKKRPYIILKWAQTKNGFVSPIRKSVNKPVWITNKYSIQLSHQWRSQEQAILVGAKTIIDDNPNLTTRYFSGKNPTRIIISNGKKFSKNYNVFDNEASTIILDPKNLKGEIPLASQICNELFNRKITSVIVEGGPKTLNCFLDQDLWDEARIFQGTNEFKFGIKAPIFDLSKTNCKLLMEDKLWIVQNK